MPKRPKTARRAGAAYKPAKKSPAIKSIASKPTTPTLFREWRERTDELLGRRGTMPERDWKRLYITHRRRPAEAARRAEIIVRA
jgi:hypothetical protein